MREPANEDNLKDLIRAVGDVVELSKVAKKRATDKQADFPRPTMADAATDTDLTPHWWSASGDNAEDMPLADLDRPRGRTAATESLAPSATLTRPRERATYPAAARSHARSDSSDEGTEGEFPEVRRRKPRVPVQW